MMGFFDLGIDTIISQKSKRRSSVGCHICRLRQGCQSPCMQPTGEGNKKILIIGEAPGQEEDEKGIPFIGKSGKHLRETFKKYKIDVSVDCKVTNSILCRPPKNREPSQSELDSCGVYLEKTISEFKPKIIVLVGTVAIRQVIIPMIEGRLKGIQSSAFIGKVIPDKRFNCWILPIYHPSYILRNPENEGLRTVWEKTISVISEYIDKDIPQVKEDIETLYQDCDIQKVLSYILERKPIIALDYETTGIKPHRTGHKIITISLAYRDSENNLKSFAFPLSDIQKTQSLFQSVMTDKEIKKVCHKADFEMMWTKVILGYHMEGLYWDTCLASHCIDSKTSVSLKFQTYINFGIVGYDREIDSYIRGSNPSEDQSSDNRFNLITKAPLRLLLKYNALDSLYTYLLYERQSEMIDPFIRKGYRFFLKSEKTLAKIQTEGMYINQELMDLYEKRLTKKIERSEALIKAFPEYKKWNGKSPLNINSDTQLRKLLYDILSYKVPEGCEENKTAEKTLLKIGEDFPRAIIPYRKYKKLRDTYLSQFKREHVNGYIFPFFNLHIARTFRSSSNSPNFQNLPKRLEGTKMIRDIIIPRPSHRIIEYDYKGVEVCISACYHKDPNMITYIKDPSTDMHRDQAAEIFIKNPKDISKEERYIAKNGFVFPSFYGSGTPAIAPGIWEMSSEESKAHLKKEGIKNIKDFYDHIFEIEQRFWNEKFPVYKEWKNKTYKEYEKKGYVELFTGFRIYGPMEFTEATNYPIQGTAFHVMLFSLNNIFPLVKKISEENLIIGQIHDSIIMDINPKYEMEIDQIVYRNGIEKPMEVFEWIIVPLTIEKEETEVDGSWAYMKSCGPLKVQ